MKDSHHYINRYFLYLALGALSPAILVLVTCAASAWLGQEVAAKDWMVAFAGFSSIVPTMLLATYDEKSWWKTAGAWTPTALLLIVSALGAAASVLGPRLEARSTHYDDSTILFAVVIASQVWGVCFGFAARREIGRADDVDTFHKQVRHGKIAG